MPFYNRKVKKIVSTKNKNRKVKKKTQQNDMTCKRSEVKNWDKKMTNRNSHATIPINSYTFVQS